MSTTMVVVLVCREDEYLIMVDPSSFGAWLRHRRQALGLTQHTLALQIGYAAVTIRKLEAGQRRPTHAMLQALGVAFALSAEDLESLSTRYLADIGPLTISGQAALPIPITPLIGRDQAVATIRRQIEHDHVRLLTLTGPPGVGKTRLAIAAAQQLAPIFLDGIGFLRCATLEAADHVLLAIAEAFSLETSATEHLLQRLAGALRTRQMLLVLDGSESVISAAPHLVRLLGQAPHLTIIITSRVAAHVEGEYVYAVPCLRVLGPTSPESVGEGEPSEALALLLDRVRVAQPELQLTAATTPILVALCQALDGLPLALELAARQLRSLDPAELLQQIRDTTKTLSVLDRASRQTMTFRSMLAASLAALSGFEQQIFWLAGVFQGSWTAAAMQAILICIGATEEGMTPASPDVIAGAIITLVEHGLVQPTPHPTGQRYLLLNIFRAYALECLAELGWVEAAQQAHAAYYHEQTLALHQESQGQLPKHWLRWLAAEEENLLAVLQWAKLQNAAEMGLQVALALYFHWMYAGQHARGRQWVLTFLAEPAIAPSTQARAEYCAGFFSFRLGEYLPARTYAWHSLQLAQQIHDRYGEAGALFLLALIALEQQSFEAAAAALQQCIAIRQQIHDDFNLGNAILNQGVTCYYWGKYHEALAAYRQARPIIERQGDPVQLAAVLGNTGLVLIELTEYEEAMQLIQEALAIFRTQHMIPDVAYATLNLAYGAALQGKWEKVRTLIREGVALLKEIGDTGTLPEANQTLAYMAYHQGNFPEAWRLYHESLSQCEEIGEIRRIPMALWGMGRVAHVLGWWDAAQSALEECYALYDHRHQAIGMAEVRDAQAALAMTEAHYVQAEHYYTEANTIRAALATPRHHLEHQAYEEQSAFLSLILSC